MKEKIEEIKSHNEISFIMAVVGNEPELSEDLSFDLPPLIIQRKAQSETL